MENKRHGHAQNKVKKSKRDTNPSNPKTCSSLLSSFLLPSNLEPCWSCDCWSNPVFICEKFLAAPLHFSSWGCSPVKKRNTPSRKLNWMVFWYHKYHVHWFWIFYFRLQLAYFCTFSNAKQAGIVPLQLFLAFLFIYTMVIVFSVCFYLNLIWQRVDEKADVWKGQAPLQIIKPSFN